MGQRVPPMAPIRDYVVDELVEQFERKDHHSGATARALTGALLTAGSMRPVVPSATFCAYCRRQHSPDHTNCEGCGAPKTAHHQGGVLVCEGALTDAQAREIRREWYARYSNPSSVNWPEVPANRVVR